MYHGTGINDSPTIVAKAAANIENGAFLAATLTKDGATIAKAGEAAIGILIPETDSPKIGEDINIQVKDAGLAKVGAAVNAGDLLASDANGKLVKAESGAFILAAALETATAADQVISVQIIKAGFMADATTLPGGDDDGDDDGDNN